MSDRFMDQVENNRQRAAIASEQRRRDRRIYIFGAAIIGAACWIAANRGPSTVIYVNDES
jgi:hypothetical protein